MTTTTTSSFATASADHDAQPFAGGGLLQRGDVLGRYEILFPLATGGMASVYAARLLGEGMFQRPVAIKVMLPHLAQDERLVAMFIDEAALAARVESPHVVQVIELGRHAGMLFIAMDLVVGVSLRQVFDRSEGHATGLSLPVLCSVLTQAASGLNDAHEARAPNGERLGIVHRDISPHNVLVGVDGRARITDFGIARAIERVSATETGELKGKLPYFSPEQARCADLDARSDVFSLGIVAWEMLAAQRLFNAPNPLAIAQAVAAKIVPRLDTLERGIPSAVADVIERALERDPAKRLPSADAFARGLSEASLRTCGLADAREVGAALRALCGDTIERVETALSGALATRTAGYPALPAKVSPRRPRAWMLAVLAVLLLFIVFGITNTQKPPPVGASAPSVSVPEAGRPAPEEPSVERVEPARGALPSVAPPSSSPTADKPGLRAPRRRAHRAEARRAPAAGKAPVEQGLLRKIEDFDRERSQ